jgi:ribose transport system substrate-binding protein
MCADVNERILDMIKSGEVFGSINPNQGMQGYIGFLRSTSLPIPS